MSAIESAGLAFCADKFMIPRLLRKALKRLKPMSAQDVFPALICVTYANFSDLETQVCKIIQQETEKVVGSADFLKLDEESLLFILKQNTLKIDEVELWKHVVRWAEHQVKKNPTRTVRDCLTKILGYVRFLTFTSDEILDYVLPAEALSPEEFMDLTLAVRKNQPLKSSLFCDVREKRNIYQDEEVKGQNIEDNKEDKVEDDESGVNNSEIECEECDDESEDCDIEIDGSFYFRASDHFDLVWKNEYSLKSSFTIISNMHIEIEYLSCERENYTVTEQYICNITVEKESYMIEQLDTVKGSADPDHFIVLPLKFNSGLPIKMNPEEKWKFTLTWDEPQRGLPVYNLEFSDQTGGVVDVTRGHHKGKDMTVIYDGPFHVREIDYRKKQSWTAISKTFHNIINPQDIEWVWNTYDLQ